MYKGLSVLRKRSKYMLSADAVVFGYSDGQLWVALIERKNEPFKGMWAIPGGFVEGDETIEEAASRELLEETGIDRVYLEQFHVFSAKDRDPRGRVITSAFFALVDSKQYQLIASEDAAKAKWWPAYDLPPLAFDHDKIFEMALAALRQSVSNKNIVFELLPKEFTLTEFQTLYEQIYDTKIDKRNFRKKMMVMPHICPTDKMTKGKRHRPAQLYKYDKKKLEKF